MTSEQQAKQAGFAKGRMRTAMNELGVVTVLIDPAAKVWGFQL